MKRFAVSFLGVLMIVMAVSGCTGKKPAEQYVSGTFNNGEYQGGDYYFFSHKN